MTAAVAITGIVVTSVGTAGPSAVAGRKPAIDAVAAGHPVIPSSGAHIVKPTHRQVKPVPKPQLRHPKHERWSKLLPTTPTGWTVTHAAAPMSIGTLSKEFAAPTTVRSQLHFNGFRRAVMVGVRGGKFGTVEQIWQFRRPTGAAAWFAEYLASNRPSTKTGLKKGFVVGRSAMGFTAGKVDSIGYHFGVGVALEGDMVVFTRVYSTRHVNRRLVSHQIRRQVRPVGHGITSLGIVTELQHLHSPSHHKASTVNT
jgi:hypothetical protein